MTSEPMPTSTTSRLSGHDLTLAYGDTRVAEHLSVAIPDGAFTVIVGPNACGKSTLLKALARLRKPQAGQVYLDGALIGSYPTREVARRLGLLPQNATAPEGIRVAELVARGRHPHQSLFGRWTAEDDRIVTQALRATATEDLADRLVDELSGGQRQRVWVAMVLAQDTQLLLLDEPTTYLDLAHQIDLLELFRDLNRQQGRTLIAVLHDLNHACRYADHLVVLRQGQLVAQGAPGEIITAELVERVFDLPCRIIEDPVSGTPLVIPEGRKRG
ncbi:MAG: ABC transporter ATP-binding protein [Rhodoferax sp.]|uniref:ABC transporter ATP-binding protein n=1 Tax=Rhodoferax sp. TaxID=50421 RepID=UPI003267C3E2